MPSTLRVSKDKQVVVICTHELGQVVHFQIIDDLAFFHSGCHEHDIVEVVGIIVLDFARGALLSHCKLYFVSQFLLNML